MGPVFEGTARLPRALSIGAHGRVATCGSDALGELHRAVGVVGRFARNQLRRVHDLTWRVPIEYDAWRGALCIPHDRLHLGLTCRADTPKVGRACPVGKRVPAHWEVAVEVDRVRAPTVASMPDGLFVPAGQTVYDPLISVGVCEWYECQSMRAQPCGRVPVADGRLFDQASCPTNEQLGRCKFASMNTPNMKRVQWRIWIPKLDRNNGPLVGLTGAYLAVGDELWSLSCQIGHCPLQRVRRPHVCRTFGHWRRPSATRIMKGLRRR